MRGGEPLAVIECKKTPSQSGQFVVIDNNQKFIFSNKNKSPENDFTRIIINIINADYPKYKKVAQSGIRLELEKVASQWIVDFYKQHKHVSYICFSEELDTFFFSEIEKFNDVFDITASLRRKKSGSRKLPEKHKDAALRILRNHDPHIRLVKVGNTYKVLARNSNTFDVKNKFKGDSSSTFDEDAAIYITKAKEVKILSATNNPNVIFSIKLSKNWHKHTIEIKEIINRLININ
jgi:hypothetical protein